MNEDPKNSDPRAAKRQGLEEVLETERVKKETVSKDMENNHREFGPPLGRMTGG